MYILAITDSRQCWTCTICSFSSYKVNMIRTGLGNRLPATLKKSTSERQILKSAGCLKLKLKSLVLDNFLMYPKEFKFAAFRRLPSPNFPIAWWNKFYTQSIMLMFHLAFIHFRIKYHICILIFIFANGHNTKTMRGFFW